MPSLFAEYTQYDALGLAELVANGDVHPRELVETCITHIERLNPCLNAVVYTMYDHARAAAESNLPEGPFRGVPYLLKDMVAHAGTPCTFGSSFFHKIQFTPDVSHPIVDRSQGAGLIFVGKTNAPEFGLLPTTEPEHFGPTANPWDLDHSPGGSSGGAGSAVAAGLVPMAHGNDGGGSIRIPSACCGVFGLKPSRGRNPGFYLENPDGLVAEHCLARTVRDSAALLDVTCGPQPGDRWWAPPPSGSYREAASTPPGPLKIAFTTADLLDRPAHPDCRAAVVAAAQLCESLGHDVEEARPPVEGARFNEAFITLWTSMAASIFAAILQQARKQPMVDLAARLLGERFVIEVGTRYEARSLTFPFESMTREAAHLGEEFTHAEAFLAGHDLQRIGRQMGQFLATYDCYLTPVLADPPLRTGALSGLDLEALKQRVLAYGGYTPICNVTGLPAMSVPLHWNAAGLPIGVQFISGFARETTLFQLAGQLEQAQPWWDRTPPVFAG